MIIMINNRNRTLAIAVTAILLASISPVSSQSSTDCNDETNSFIVPETDTIKITDDLTVTVPCDIIINGAIIAEAETAASIILEAGRNIHVAGPLIASDGNTDSPNGGSIYLTSEESLDIISTAVLQAGNGANGKDAYAIQETGAYSQSCDCVKGGDGGDGGDVTVTAPAQQILGSLLAGDGGNGGIATHLGRVTHAIGGAGGNTGFVKVALDDAEEALARNLSGDAGDGGYAFSFSRAEGETWGIYGDPGDNDQDSCDATAFALILLNNANLILQGETQQPSGSLSATSVGGTAGNGILEGGTGGSAEAIACENTQKGNPGDAGEESHWEGMSWKSPEAGDDGSTGNTGGLATATGGEGGKSIFKGGEGGASNARGGAGSIGGAGGRGGDGNDICEDGADGGDGGLGGLGGKATSDGGDGGDVLFELGAPGAGGAGTGQSGAGGAGGEGGEGGNGGIDASIGYIINIGCTGDKGGTGGPGGVGTSPRAHTESGDTGDDGFMSLDDAMREITLELN